ncbi:MAG: hypothetical protein QGH40_15250 [bacterium]|nr:hypothetical protein [bacterium]
MEGGVITFESVAALLVIGILKLHCYIPDILTGSLTMVKNMTLPILLIYPGGSLYVDFKQKRPSNR